MNNMGLILDGCLDQPVYALARDGFGRGLLGAGEKYPEVVALTADVAESVRLTAFATAFPERFFEMGVAEQNLLGVAAGLALTGKIPFAVSYAAFNPGRNWDQLRVSVAYSRSNVKVVGSHAGVNVGPDGATHQALEDVAITRVLPNLAVVVPTDALETEKAVEALVNHVGPVYMRFGREASPQVTVKETPFIIGKANLLRPGRDLTICANGELVWEALMAAEILAKEGLRAEVIAVPTVKPLDDEAILKSARKTGGMIVAEEAQISGGLAGAIAELLSEKNPLPLRRIGVRDSFGQSGKAEELLDRYGLRADNIVRSAKEVITLRQER